MTALAATVQGHINTPPPPFGNWTRYILTIRDHEEWIFQSNDHYRSDEWWNVNVNAKPPYNNGPNHWRDHKDQLGWIKIEGQHAIDFQEGWQSPFFETPRQVYKLLRICLRRYQSGYGNTPLTQVEQRRVWAWAKDNLVVYKINFNLHTLTATKEEISFKRDCCPKSISLV